MELSAEEQYEKTMPVAWQHNKDLRDCMTELYEKKLWTDVKFRCKDHDENERIHAHKIVLAARSPVFQAMFFGPCANGKDDVLLENIEAEILDLFLRYIYSERVTLAEENAFSVLEISHYYQVSSLVQFCADYLASILSSENACEILTLALRFEVSTLRDACCTFIDKNAEDILSSEGFLELPEESFAYILKGDTFHTYEDDIFIKAEEWSKRKLEEGNLEKTGPNVRTTLGESFYYLRLPTLTYKTFMNCTRKKGYFSAEEYEDIVDFINEIPDSFVNSNSCVARLPPEEVLTINYEDGKTNINNRLTTSFQISASKDVKLKNVTLTEIQKYFKYNGTFYSTRNCRHESVYESETKEFFSNYEGKVIRLEGSMRSKRACALKESKGTDLPEDLNIIISGNLQVTCKKIKLPDNTVCCDKSEKQREDAEEGEIDNNLREEDTDENENGPSNVEGSNDDDDDDNDECLIFEQDIQLLSTEEKSVIDLNEPLTLTKIGSPYTIAVHLMYSCDSEVKMKTCNSSDQIVTSEYGHLKVENISGKFAGVKSIGFENISDRETVKEII